MSEIRQILPTLERLRGFSDLEENWDSYGAYPPKACAYTDAAMLLVRSLELFDWADIEVDAVPTSGGGVLIEWQRNGRQCRHQIWIDGDHNLKSLNAVKVTLDEKTKTQRFVDQHADSIEDALASLKRTMEPG
jgi:hypothetical protein